MKTLNLRYGLNPNQNKAELTSRQELPIQILNGTPSYINILDAMNAYQLAKELYEATNLPAAAASFKHVSPAGAAIYKELSSEEEKAYFVEGQILSPLAIAYVKARGCDRVSSFGDCAAFSGKVDRSVAELLRKEVSDVIIAPDYEEEAIDIVKSKKKGNYLIIKIDSEYEPMTMEERTLYGMTLLQERNNQKVGYEIFDPQNIVTIKKQIPEEVKHDLLVALITLKYTQSNSVCFVKGGQTIGIGAGQQSRIHCTRLAAAKAENWFLRQHPLALNMDFKETVTRTDKSNAIDLWQVDTLTNKEEQHWQNYFRKIPEKLTRDERNNWLSQLDDVSYASDAFLPFRDNIDRASQCGVKYVAQTGHSQRDQEVITAANEYEMTMLFTGIRLFHH